MVSNGVSFLVDDYYALQTEKQFNPQGFPQPNSNGIVNRNYIGKVLNLVRQKTKFMIH